MSSILLISGRAALPPESQPYFYNKCNLYRHIVIANLLDIFYFFGLYIDLCGLRDDMKQVEREGGLTPTLHQLS